MTKRMSALFAILLSLLMVLPSQAMMDGGHRHMQGSRQDEDGTTPPGEDQSGQATGHRHGNYYHSHVGGELPHSHEGTRVNRQPATEPETVPARRKSHAPPGASPVAPLPAEHSSATGTGPIKQHSTQQKPNGGESRKEPVSAASAILQSRDDMLMHLVAGGTVTIPGGGEPAAQKQFEANPFYMDETLVTNHQYVAFLNKSIDRIKVEDGVVRGPDGKLWLFLGEVKAGYQPIIYQDGRFEVNGAHHAACAVLRVTAYGAQAYAQSYGKRLPAAFEWFHAVSTGQTADAIGLPVPSPVMLYPADHHGIRGLNSNIGEWTTRTVGREGENQAPETTFMVLGGAAAAKNEGTSPGPGVARYPWEAFAQVGFRCVSAVAGMDPEPGSPKGQ